MRFTGRTFVRVAIALGATILTLVVAAEASGHDTWILAQSGVAQVGQPVQLDLTSGMLFPADDFAIEPSRVNRAVSRTASGVQPLPRPTLAAKSLRYRWVPAMTGVATIGVELAPKTLTLEPDKIEEYLGEIDAGPALRATWKSLGAKAQWTESYTKHATTFIRVRDSKNQSPTDSSWARPLGFGLEIVPERDPTSIHAKDSLAVRVLRNGAPLADFAVGVIPEGTDQAKFFRTDATGRTKVAFGKQGRWLLNGTLLRRSTNQKTVWESDFVTMTVHVRS